MKKIIDIPEDVKVKLSVMAVKAGKDLKNYIQDLLIKHSEAEAEHGWLEMLIETDALNKVASSQPIMHRRESFIDFLGYIDKLNHVWKKKSNEEVVDYYLSINDA